MGRIPLIDPEEPGAPAVLRSLRDLGADYNVFRGLANHPQALDGMLELMRTVYWGNSLTPAERELAWLTASTVNDCHY